MIKMYKDLKFIGIILIILALGFGFFIRAFVISHFADFGGDQIRDAYAVMGIWEGKLPTLGPISAWGEVYLPPLYFYLVFPFTAFSPDLSSQAIFNAIFTFLSIPLLMLTIYKMLENVKTKKRFFLSSLAGLWYSSLFANIIMNTESSLAGNPGSIVFFFLAFILLYTYQLESQISLALEIISWLIYGIVLGILVSLHFAPLFIMPVIFFGSTIVYFWKNYNNRKRWLLPGAAVLSALLTLTPYWLGEVSRNWQNSQRIIGLVFPTSSQQEYSVTFLQRLNGIAGSYLDLGKEIYFIGTSWKSTAISVLFLLTVLVLGLIKFKGNKIIFYLLLMTWVLFLYAYSSANMQNTYNPVFYKLLIYLAPIFLSIWGLAYLNFSQLWGKILIAFIVFCLTVSIVINLKFHYNYIMGRIGIPRIANTSDLIEVLKQIPEQSTVCDPAGYKPNIKDDEYTDRHVTKRGLKFVPNCQSGYYFTYPKYEPLGNYTARKTKPFAEAFPQFNQDYRLFQETPLFYIYHLN